MTWKKQITWRSSTLHRNNTAKPRLGARRRNASVTAVSLCPRPAPCCHVQSSLPRPCPWAVPSLQGALSFPWVPILHHPTVCGFWGRVFRRLWATWAARLVPSWRLHAIRVRCVTACPVPPWAPLLHCLQPGPPPPSLLLVPTQAASISATPKGWLQPWGSPCPPAKQGLGWQRGRAL